MGAGADSAEETDLVDDGPSSGRVKVDVITGGLFSHEKARSNRSQCWICNKKIATGEWRLYYAIRESTSLRDKRRLHILCVDQLPIRTRALDQAYLERAIGATADADELAAMERAYDALTLSGGAGPSSAGETRPSKYLSGIILLN